MCSSDLFGRFMNGLKGRLERIIRNRLRGRNGHRYNISFSADVYAPSDEASKVCSNFNLRIEYAGRTILDINLNPVKRGPNLKNE